MTNAGYIRAYRSIFETWEHGGNPLMVAAWLYILAHTAYTEMQDDGVTLHPGEVVMSRTMLARQYGIPIRQAEVILRKLTVSGEIELIANNRKAGGAVYRVVNYANYNSLCGGITVEKNTEIKMEKNKEENGKNSGIKSGEISGITVEKNTVIPSSTEGACARNLPCCEAIKKRDIYMHVTADAGRIPLPNDAAEIVRVAWNAWHIEWSEAVATEFFRYNEARGWRGVVDWHNLIPIFEESRRKRR